jgi:integrase
MAARRANGEGTIYRRKDGRYEAAVYVRTTAGTRKRQRVYGKTRTEVRQQLVETQSREQQGIPTAARNWRLDEYLDYWLETIIRPNRRLTTYEVYELTVRCNLKPGLGNRRLDRLTVPLVQTFLNEQVAAGKSTRKVHIIRTVLSSALTQAMREELIGRNVARLIVLPTWQAPDVVPWTPDEAQAFLQAAQPSRYYAAFVLLLLYGLRRGEVLGLRWQDVDEAAGVIRIRQQLQRRNSGLLFGPVKTRAGQRDLPLLGLARRVLANQRTMQAALGAAGDRDLVFTSSSGEPVEPKNLVRSFHAISEQQSLRRIKLHHLRHTTATLLKNLGVSARDAQLILGHSQISVTQQIYQHDSLDERRVSLERVEKLFMRQEAPALPSKLPLLPSNVDNFAAQFTTKFGQKEKRNTLRWRAFLGGPSGARTHDTLLKRSPNDSFYDRLASVREVQQVRTMLWLLGLIAVTAAVNNFTSPSIATSTKCPHCGHEGVTS